MLIDSSTFTTHRMRLELLMWASQNEVRTKRGEVKVFEAIALTDAVPLSRRDLDNYGRKTEGDSAATVGRYVLRVRIKNDLYEASPHQYLPDPCALDTTANVAEAVKLIKLHTLCLTSADYQLSDVGSIKRNDIVKITLNMNRETNTVNSEHGIVTALVKRADPLLIGEPICEDLSGKFLINIIERLKSYDSARDEPGPGQEVGKGKCPAEVPPSQLDFSGITAIKPGSQHRLLPDGNNNYRYQQPSLGNIKWYYNKGVRRFLRLNRDGDNDLTYTYDEQIKTCVTIKIEEAYVKSLGAQFKRQSAHSPSLGVKGKGYYKSVAACSKWFKKGNTMVHCKHGADRTGLVVAGWLQICCGKNRSWLWTYTTGLNSWEKYICKDADCGFAHYLDSFWAVTSFCKSHPGCAICTPADRWDKCPKNVKSAKEAAAAAAAAAEEE